MLLLGKHLNSIQLKAAAQTKENWKIPTTTKFGSLLMGRRSRPPAFYSTNLLNIFLTSNSINHIFSDSKPFYSISNCVISTIRNYVSIQIAMNDLHQYQHSVRITINLIACFACITDSIAMTTVVKCCGTQTINTTVAFHVFRGEKL